MNSTLLNIGEIVSRNSGEQIIYNNENKNISTLVIYPDYVYGLMTLAVGQEITLLSWLHNADRKTLQIFPRGDNSRPKRGVFNTRSAARPNPIGIHEVVIQKLSPLDNGSIHIEVTVVEGETIDCFDGTPIIDIKTNSAQRTAFVQSKQNNLIPNEQAKDLIAHCHKAWSLKLMSGFNSNASVRYDSNKCIITSNGSVKAALSASDLALVDIENAKLITGARPSSELNMHLEIYKNQELAQAIVHTHPPKMLALLSLIENDELLNIDIFEAEALKSKLKVCPAISPGTQNLASSIGEIAKEYQAIVMSKHGLCCWASNLKEALAISEELEHLAAIQLDILGKLR